MKKILISACLLGQNCKYNGGNNLNPYIISLKKDYLLIPFCPESEGGLSTPRDPSEIKGSKVISNKNKDVTSNFKKGAELALSLAKENEIDFCILKEGSPSCGVHLIYDGSFKGIKVKGEGITTRLLKEHYPVYSENEIEDFIKENH